MAANFHKPTGKEFFTIDSASIKVFPCAYRGEGIDKYAQLNTEYNITHLPGTSTSRTYRLSELVAGSDKTLELVIDGYYFYISGLELTTAGVKINNSYIAKYFSIITTALESGVPQSKILKDVTGVAENATLDFEINDVSYFLGLAFSDTQCLLANTRLELL